MAFIRRQPARSAADIGTRPGLHGQTLISCGLADLDKLLGGGLPLGCIWLVLEDEHSQQHLTLQRYFLAEGLACQHATCWVTPRSSATSATTLIPPQASSSSSSAAKDAAGGITTQAGTQHQQQQKGTLTSPTTPAATAAASRSSSSSASQQEGAELRIAWQYRKYIKEREQQSEAAAAAAASSRPKTSSFTRPGSAAVEAGIAREWCHKFDLTKSTTPEQLTNSSLQLHCRCSGQPTQLAASSTEIGPSASSSSTTTTTTTTTSQPTASSSTPGLQGVGRQQQACGGLQGSSDWAAAAASFVQRFRQSGPVPVPPRAPLGVGRLVIESLGSLDWQCCSTGPGDHPDHYQQQQQQHQPAGGAVAGSPAATEQQLLQAVAQLRLLLQDSYCAALITCPAGLYSPSFAAQLQHLADVVVSLETLADDSDVYQLLPDAASAVALLHLRRLPPAALFRQRPLDHSLYVVRNKRRAISLAAVEVDPDAGEGRQQQQQPGGGGGKAGAGGGKSAAAVACGGPPGARNPLDF